MRDFQPVPRPYELMVLVSPEVTDDALTSAVDEVSGYITAVGGRIDRVKRDTPWGRRRLAYPIQNFRDATYVLFNFGSAPARIRDIERELKLDERIIRYLVVRQDEAVAVEETAPAEGAEETVEAAAEPSEEPASPVASEEQSA